MNGRVTPADFAGADDIITNLAKEREPGIEIIEHTPQSLIITSLTLFNIFTYIIIIFNTKFKTSLNPFNLEQRTNWKQLGFTLQVKRLRTTYLILMELNTH